MHEAVLLHADDGPVLRFERFLPQPVEAVWRAVTEPDELRSWFPTRIQLDDGWTPGAALVHHFPGRSGPPLPGRVLACEPPRRLSFTWGEDTITFELSPTDGGTTFVLTERLGAARAARNAAGWEVCLERLVTGGVSEDWASRFDRYQARFQPLLGLQERAPTGDH